MENKHKAAGKESMSIRNQKKNNIKTNQNRSKLQPAATKRKKSK